MTDEKVVQFPPVGARPVVWDDIQDLRRGLQGYIDVKIDGLRDEVNARFDTLEARFDKIERILEERL